MSNIANQLVAVVATLMGFVAHDVLSDRQAAPAAVTDVAMIETVDPVVTRSIDLDGASVSSFLELSMHADRETQPAPASRMTVAAGPARLDAATSDTELADISLNEARSMAPAQQMDTSALR